MQHSLQCQFLNYCLLKKERKKIYVEGHAYTTPTHMVPRCVKHHMYMLRIIHDQTITSIISTTTDAQPIFTPMPCKHLLLSIALIFLLCLIQNTKDLQLNQLSACRLIIKTLSNFILPRPYKCKY